MAKNILLLILSPVQTKMDGGKVTINEKKYVNVDGDATKMTNESAVRYLVQELSRENSSLDKIFIFTSKRTHDERIFFTDRDEKCSHLFYDDDGKTLTHLEFFRKRVEKFLPPKDCPDFPYNEDATVNENLKEVAKLAGEIQKFAAKFQNEEIILHVDLTGGMRDINMMMLDLTRLLEYSGLKVDKLLYSDYGKSKVESLKNIYDMFQLIAGVEEFVNFGSVKALNRYYAGKKLSVPLEKLRNAMEDLAAAIKLCRYDPLDKAVKDLHVAVRDFENYTPVDMEDSLMARLIGRIRKDYHDLIANFEKDDVEVIRWCLHHDYMQQALTLYTERIPEYLGEKNFVTLSAKHDEKLTDECEQDEMGRNKFYYLFNVYSPKRFDGFGKYCTLVKDNAVTDIRKRKFDFDAWLNDFNSKVAEENFLLEDEPRLRLQLATLEKIWSTPELLDDLSSAKLEPLRKLIDVLSTELEKIPAGFKRVKFLFNEIGQLAKEHNSAKPDQRLFKDFFPGVVFAKDFSEKYPPRIVNVIEMINAEIFSVNIVDEDKFKDIMGKYFVIRDERNHSNHAHPNSDMTADKLKNFMLDALDEIKKFLPATA